MTTTTTMTMTTTTTIEIILTMIYTDTSPGVHSLNSVEGPGLKGGPRRVPRGAQGEVHLDLDIGIAEKERST